MATADEPIIFALTPLDDITKAVDGVLRDYADVDEQIAEARQCGHEIAILVWWNGSDFDRAPGTYLTDAPFDSFTDRGIRRLIDPPAGACFTDSRRT